MQLTISGNMPPFDLHALSVLPNASVTYPPDTVLYVHDWACKKAMWTHYTELRHLMNPVFIWVIHDETNKYIDKYNETNKL